MYGGIELSGWGLSVGLGDRVSAPLPQVESTRTWRYRRIERKTEQWAREAGLTPIQAALIAGRIEAASPGDMERRFVHVRLASLTKPHGLPDIDIAASRVARAVQGSEHIGIETDHDVDGVTSHAIIHRALCDCFGVSKDRIHPFIGHRLREGYGLSEGLVDRIVGRDTHPDLIITADNGSADETGIRRLRETGIETIVTDHHAIPKDGIPRSALACVSPAREDSRYGDPTIAGCMVAWLLMMRVWRDLEDAGHPMPEGVRDTLTGMLAEVAAGTVADCVTLGESTNNRVVVTHGLERMNHPHTTRPCWRVAALNLTRNEREMTAEDLAFGVGPRINARGRLDEAMAGVRFLLAETEEEAAQWWRMLDAENEKRKTIEKDLKQRAMKVARHGLERGAKGLFVWLPQGHPGVHGIVASRIVEAYGCPVLCVSPVWNSELEVTGSARGIEGFHVSRAFEAIAAGMPGLLDRFGGHKGAGGLRLRRSKLEQLAKAWEDVCAEHLEAAGVQVGPVLDVDGWDEEVPLTVESIREIKRLGPFGRGFPYPVFVYQARIESVRRMGDGTHLRWHLQTVSGQRVQAVAFNALAASDPLPWEAGQTVEVAGRPDLNHYSGQIAVQLIVDDMRSIAEVDAQ